MIKMKRLVCIFMLFAISVSASGCNLKKNQLDTLKPVQENSDEKGKGDEKLEESKNITPEKLRIEVFPEGGPSTPGIKEEMKHYEFWTSKLEDGNKVIMDIKAIEAFNEEINKKDKEVYNLQDYKESLSKKELTDFIKEYKLPDKQMYDDKGKGISKEFLNSVSSNLNISAIADINKVRYGISTKKISLRSFPTDTGFYDSATSTAFDRIQETGCEASEPVLILHESKDKKWYFVQMYNYRGWAKADGVAKAVDKNELFSFVNSENFITITGNHVEIDNELNYDSGVNKIFNMGDKLIIQDKGENYDKYGKDCYVVKLPIRKQDGTLDFKEALINKTKDAVKGYLPYTRENIIKEAFKLQGDKYDWGNKFNGRDCSSFIACIYKTFGFLLPRNADDQENSIGKSIKFTQADTVDKRSKLLDGAKPGAAIYMPGHVTMYIGKFDGVHYMIHDFSSYGKKDGNNYIYTSVMAVAVTSTLLTVSSGTPYIQKFTSALQFEK